MPTIEVIEDDAIDLQAQYVNIQTRASFVAEEKYKLLKVEDKIQIENGQNYNVKFNPEIVFDNIGRKSVQKLGSHLPTRRSFTKDFSLSRPVSHSKYRKGDPSQQLVVQNHNSGAPVDELVDIWEDL